VIACAAMTDLALPGLSGFLRFAGKCLPADHTEATVMDSDHFDRLVRTFGQTRSRRQTLRGLPRAAAAGALALGGREASADLCKSTGRACMKDGRCYSGPVCVDSGARTNSPKKNNNTCQPASNTCIPFYDACPVGCSGDSACQARCSDEVGTA
jgi:hypothetical protein